MKRIIALFMVVILTICATISATADSNVGNIYQIGNVSIVFDADSQFSNEQQEAIANLLVYPEFGVAKANLICNIFGHKNTTEGVTTITHKVLVETPRCLQENFTITITPRAFMEARSRSNLW